MTVTTAQRAAIEILQIGPSQDLFQVSDGERFVLLDFAGAAVERRHGRLHQARVLDYLSGWLVAHGAFAGSQVAPRLAWSSVEAAVADLPG